MSFTVTAKEASASTSQSTPQSNAPSARDRAIAMLTQSAPQTPGALPAPAEVLQATADASTTPKDEMVKATEGQAGSTEGEDKSKPEATEKALSPQYAALARKEKALRSQVQQLKAQQAAFKAEQDAFKATSQAPSSSFDESKYIPKDRLKSETLAVLAEEGISYDEITNAILNRPSSDPAMLAAIQKLENQIKAQADAQAKATKAQEDSQTQAYKQAVHQITTDAKALVATDPAFEMIQGTGSVKDVVELIERTFKEDGILLSVEDAAKEVEEYLVEEAFKLTRLNKIQQRLKPATPTPEAPKQAAPEAKQQQGMKTLTNAVGSSRPLTARERAILAFQGKLNK